MLIVISDPSRQQRSQSWRPWKGWRLRSNKTNPPPLQHIPTPTAWNVHVCLLWSALLTLSICPTNVALSNVSTPKYKCQCMQVNVPKNMLDMGRSAWHYGICSILKRDPPSCYDCLPLYCNKNILWICELGVECEVRMGGGGDQDQNYFTGDWLIQSPSQMQAVAITELFIVFINLCWSLRWERTSYKHNIEICSPSKVDMSKFNNCLCIHCVHMFAFSGRFYSFKAFLMFSLAKYRVKMTVIWSKCKCGQLKDEKEQTVLFLFTLYYNHQIGADTSSSGVNLSFSVSFRFHVSCFFLQEII